jgi:hypothetical protein
MYLSKITTFALLSFLAGKTVAESGVWAYTCFGCECDAFQSLGDIGSTNSKQCVDLDSGAAALGLSENTAGAGLGCCIYSGSGCTGSNQQIGVGPGETWGCTNSDINWIFSVKCDYFNAFTC